MSHKRSRAAFEADLQAQQSPYVVYGTPLPPVDPEVRDDGSYVPIWKQEVTDEQGRKRLHGAFTGGFSAGYFNTVGSKEGWTPSAFVSSRSNRQKDAGPNNQRPEDFMDDEDRADAEEARKLQTADTFAGLGSEDSKAGQEASIMEILKTAGETMGVRLLKKMGWREGQGVGPKVRRSARLGDEEESNGLDGEVPTHLFAPENSKMISLIRKDDTKGLGFGGLQKSPPKPLAKEGEDDVDSSAAVSTSLVPSSSRNTPKKKPQARGGLGVGILNDNGSDDEDTYQIGPQISYNKVIGGDKKKKKPTEKPGLRTSSNPLLSSKPVFIPKKSAAERAKAFFRRCHDGRLPLDGFVLGDGIAGESLAKSADYPPLKIPEGWKSSKSNPNGATLQSQEYKSVAQVATISQLSPKSRAAALGEAQLPGKSVFDFLNPAARDRIVAATNNSSLPPALNEAAGQDAPPQLRHLSSLVPYLDPEIARTALGRGIAGWMPYTEDLAKRGRYRSFLEFCANSRPAQALPERAVGASNDEWETEMKEFARAAEVFKPMTGSMASRFTSSSSTPQLASDNVKSASTEGVDDDASLLSRPSVKIRTPAEEAAAVGMYGHLTRSIDTFYPTRLLCKRFNVKPPSHVQMDVDSNATSGRDHPDTAKRGQNANSKPINSEALPSKQLELVGGEQMAELKMASLRHAPIPPITSKPIEDNSQQGTAAEVASATKVVDPDRNEALETDRPGEAVFKAIFGSDSEDE